MWHMSGHIITVDHNRGGCIGVAQFTKIVSERIYIADNILHVTLQNLKSEYPFAKELVFIVKLWHLTC